MRILKIIIICINILYAGTLVYWVKLYRVKSNKDVDESGYNWKTLKILMFCCFLGMIIQLLFYRPILIFPKDVYFTSINITYHDEVGRISNIDITDMDKIREFKNIIDDVKGTRCVTSNSSTVLKPDLAFIDIIEIDDKDINRFHMTVEEETIRVLKGIMAFDVKGNTKGEISEEIFEFIRNYNNE